MEQKITELETKLEQLEKQIEENNEGGDCLIVTATFGSELFPQVQQLREIRDNSLLQTQSVQAFMQGFK